MFESGVSVPKIMLSTKPNLTKKSCKSDSRHNLTKKLKVPKEYEYRFVDIDVNKIKKILKDNGGKIYQKRFKMRSWTINGVL